MYNRILLTLALSMIIVSLEQSNVSIGKLTIPFIQQEIQNANEMQYQVINTSSQATVKTMSTVNDLPPYAEIEISKPKTVVLDAGHNYNETYKSSPDKYLEVTYNLQMVKLVKKHLETLDPTIQVIETNPDGTNTLRKDRSLVAKEYDADLLLSLHMNAMGTEWQTDFQGSLVIVDALANDAVVDLAHQFSQDYAQLTGIQPVHSNAVEIREYDTPNEISLLHYTSKLGIPAVLLEMGFMDNKEEAFFFREEENQDQVAASIAQMIIDNWESITIAKGGNA